MAWTVEPNTPTPGTLRLVLAGNVSVEEMGAFVRAHNGAIDAFGGRDYKVWCDIRTLLTLSPDAAEMLEGAKRYSSKQVNFRGSAVWVANATVALQHRRTSVSGGVMETELISESEEACREHLKRVYRTAPPPSSGNPRLG